MRIYVTFYVFLRRAHFFETLFKCFFPVTLNFQHILFVYVSNHYVHTNCVHYNWSRISTRAVFNVRYCYSFNREVRSVFPIIFMFIHFTVLLYYVTGHFIPSLVNLIESSPFSQSSSLCNIYVLGIIYSVADCQYCIRPLRLYRSIKSHSPLCVLASLPFLFNARIVVLFSSKFFPKLLISSRIVCNLADQSQYRRFIEPTSSSLNTLYFNSFYTLISLTSHFLLVKWLAAFSFLIPLLFLLIYENQANQSP